MTTRQDDVIRETGSPAADESSAARLFDIRRIIGGLFLLYGVLLTIAGIVDGSAAEKKAAGIDINIWTGLAMALFGLLMLAWMKLRPLEVEPEVRREEDAEGTVPREPDARAATDTRTDAHDARRS